jgi:hypothetical protein
MISKKLEATKPTNKNTNKIKDKKIKNLFLVDFIHEGISLTRILVFYDISLTELLEAHSD